MSKKDEPKYEKKFSLIGNKILETSRATKRKSAYIKVMISDELAQKIIQSESAGVLEPLEVRALGLEWYEKV
jgi:hypothetical protein